MGHLPCHYPIRPLGILLVVILVVVVVVVGVVVVAVVAVVVVVVVVVERLPFSARPSRCPCCCLCCCVFTDNRQWRPAAGPQWHCLTIQAKHWLHCDGIVDRPRHHLFGRAGGSRPIGARGWHCQRRPAGPRLLLAGGGGRGAGGTRGLEED